jgi:thiosulfate/3-mercaptopyruvate sulfurtransferase
MPSPGAKMGPLGEYDEVTIPPFVSIDDVDRLLAEPSIHVVVADVRWYLDGRDARSLYRDGHVPDAVFVDVDTDLSAHALTTSGSPTDGRHPFPSPEAFADAMGRLGIGDDTWVVAYDDTGGMTAGRLVVMLRMLGRQAALLDGGLSAWIEKHGDRWETGDVTPARASFTPVPWPSERLASIADVDQFVSRSDTDRIVMLDARAAARFRGDIVAVDPRPGHVPGAYNSPWESLLQDGHLRAKDDLVDHYRKLCVDLADDVIASCGSGVSACLNVLAMEHAGFATPRLFVASWSGWSSDPDRATELGDSPPDRRRFVMAERRRAAQNASLGISALRDLRRTRRGKRLAQLEWFEALYRVYLAAFVFGGSFLFVSGLVTDGEFARDTTARIVAEGPGWLGVLATIVFALGLRSGSLGGPIALEEADIRHVLGAPIDRRRVLLAPALQRARTVTFAGGLAGAAAGQLSGRRLPGTELTWAMAGAAFGATIGLVFVAAALVAHTLRAPRWLATVLGSLLVAWQTVSALPDNVNLVGPADGFGGLAFWEIHVEWIDVTAPLFGLLLLTTGLLLLGRVSLEALSRRAVLVSQMRFAVTLQDLRTVMLLRRQLSHERSRARPWIGRRRNSGSRAEWQRSWHGLLRFPGARVVRIVVLTMIVGATSSLVFDGTAPLAIVAGFVSFVIGLELTEPLAQEIDHGDLTDRWPIERGQIHLGLLAAPLAASLPLAVVTAVVLGLIGDDAWTVAVVVGLPTVVAGVAGAAVSVVSGAPDPVTSVARDATLPPEIAGTANIVKAIWPIAITMTGQIPIVVAETARQSGSGPEAAALRGSIFTMLVVGLVGGWIHRRDAIRAWVDRARQESRGVRT